MLEDVKKRLESLGYMANESDNWVLDFIIQKVELHIKTQTNLSTVPEALHNAAVDMATGEFLLAKKSSGQLTTFNLDGAIKSIKLGDTTTTFEGTSSPEARFDTLISYLINKGIDYAAFRVITW